MELSTIKKHKEFCIFTFTQKQILCLGHSELSNTMNQELILHEYFVILLLVHMGSNSNTFSNHFPNRIYFRQKLSETCCAIWQTGVHYSRSNFKDSGNMFLCNVDIYLTNYAVPQLHLNIHCCNSHLF